MPPIRYYTATQEREVKVAATSPIDAARIAAVAFSGEEDPREDLKEKGHITTSVRDRDLVVREDF